MRNKEKRILYGVKIRILGASRVNNMFMLLQQYNQSHLETGYIKIKKVPTKSDKFFLK